LIRARIIIMMMMMMILTLKTRFYRLLRRCDPAYASRILVALRDKKVKEMMKKTKKKTAVTETEWPKHMLEALQRQENTRCCPGNVTISVAYSVRLPKIILEKPKLQLAAEVREEWRVEGVEPPSVSTLMTLIPANYVRAGNIDRENNVCVKHSNMQHMVRKLRPICPDLPRSSLELAGLMMCPPSKDNSLLKPLTWWRECALRTCPTCPKWEPPALAPDVLAVQLSVPQWGMAMDLRKGKEVHCLHPKILTVAEALELLGRQLEKFPTHIYKMFWQWESLEKAKAGLKPFELITEEDYQVLSSCLKGKRTILYN
jgi:hypothetical protein